jgi:hypothetical protein
LPDLLAGTIVNALDAPPTVENVQTGTFTFDSTTFGVDADGGTYVDCGVAFTAPTTGRVMLHTKASLFNNTAAQFTVVSSVIKTGSTVGAGTLFLAAGDDRGLVATGTDPIQVGMSELITGLTHGDVYNVRLEHRVGANIGTILRRWVVVAPAT